MAFFRHAGLVALFALVAASASAAPLVGYYTFDNQSNLGLDSSGNGNNLIAQGTGAGFSANGLAGGALSLGGSGFLSTSNQTVPLGFPTGGSIYTLAVSLKTNAAPAAMGLIGWGAYGSPNQVNALRLGVGSEGIKNYWWANDITAASTTNDNVWHTIVASYDGSIRRLWLDGVLVASQASSGLNAQMSNFAIGKTYSTEYFIGLLDNVAVFNAALDPNQVSAALSAVVAVPEPGGMILFGAGLLGLASLRRRKARDRLQG